MLARINFLTKIFKISSDFNIEKDYPQTDQKNQDLV